MSHPLKVRPEAEQDIEDAAHYYEAQQSGLGQQFIDEVWRCMQRIAAEPELYPLLHRQTRRALAHRFPFGVFYRLEQGDIVIIAVLHASRNPADWKVRL